MMAKRRLKILTVRQKLKIIAQVDNGKKKIEVARAFNLPPSTLTSILKAKDKLLLKSKTSENLNVKKLRNCKHESIEKTVLAFIRQARAVNIPLSGTIVQEKARLYASKMGVADFRASGGWLAKLKRKHNLTFKTMSGESADVDMDAVNEWFKQLPNILKDYEPDDIFNADETGLFYKCLPKQTLTFKKEKCYGGKMSKERITVMVGGNSSGTEKLKLMVIGKSLKPRCFKNVKNLPVIYKANRKAWMTGPLFREYMMDLDASFTKQKRKVLFFVDNCPAHPKTVKDELKSINLIFFPPNITSKAQPMDAGVIKNLKVHYRSKVVCQLIDELENALPVTTLTVLDAIQYLEQAWDNVKAETIKNCFKHVHIQDQWCDEDKLPLSHFKSCSTVTDDAMQTNDSINNNGVSSKNNDKKNNECVSASDFIENNDNAKNNNSVSDNTERNVSVIWKRLRNETGLDITFDDYVNVDDGVAAVKILDDDDLVASICTSFSDTNVDVVEKVPDTVSPSDLIAPSKYDNTNDIDLIDKILLTPSIEEIRSSLQTIHRKLMVTPEATDDIFHCYATIQSFVLNK